jgi:hypothetical protein
MPTLATDYLTSNLLNADGLESGVSIEATIVSARPREFEDGETKLIVYTDYLGKGIVLNQTRLKALIAAYWPNPDNWTGKTIIIKRGTTMYAGKETGCVVIEPVVADRIAAQQQQRPVVTSGRVELPPSPPSPPPIDDSIPF